MTPLCNETEALQLRAAAARALRLFDCKLSRRSNARMTQCIDIPAKSKRRRSYMLPQSEPMRCYSLIPPPLPPAPHLSVSPQLPVYSAAQPAEAGEATSELHLV